MEILADCKDFCAEAASALEGFASLDVPGAEGLATKKAAGAARRVRRSMSSLRQGRRRWPHEKGISMPVSVSIFGSGSLKL